MAIIRDVFYIIVELKIEQPDNDNNDNRQSSTCQANSLTFLSNRDNMVDRIE